MTPGRLESWHFPYIPVRLHLQARTINLEALLDTGFDGHIIVPPSMLASGHTPQGHLSWTLADGSSVLTPYYFGMVEVGNLGSFRVVVSALGDEPLVGREFADHFTITLDHGQQLIVEP